MTTRASLEAVTDLLTDGTHYTPPDIEDGIPFLTVKDVSENGLDFSNCSKISVTEFENAKKQNCVPIPGDILFSKDGTVGKVHLVRERNDFAVLSSLAILRPSAAVDGSYLAHFLRWPATIAAAGDKKTGSAIRRIVLRDLATLTLPLPPLDEQRRIAAILDKADALRRKRKRALDLLDSLTQSIFLEMFGSLSDNTCLWKTKSISDVCELIVDCVNRTATVVNEVTPYKMIRTTNVRNGKVDLREVRFVSEETFLRWNRRAYPKKGDVLLTREAPVGGVGVLEDDQKVFLGQRLMLYRANNSAITPDFLVWSFQDKFLTDQFDRLSSGSTVKHLPLPACRAFELRVPPLDLQRLFSKRIEKLKGLVLVGRTETAHSELLFTSLQHRAFSGQL